MWPDPDHCFQIPTDYVDQELTEKIEDTCPLWSVTAHGTKLSLENLETSLQHEELIWCRPNLSLVSLLADAKRNRPVEASQMSFQVKILERLVSVSEPPSSIAKRIERGGINIILTYILAYAKQKKTHLCFWHQYTNEDAGFHHQASGMEEDADHQQFNYEEVWLWVLAHKVRYLGTK